MADFEKKMDSSTKLPKACVDRVIHNALPPSVNISKEMRSVLLDYGVSFVQFISIGAYEMCEKKKRKTITPEHIIQALSKFGFESYMKECEATLSEYQSLINKRPSKRNALEDSGLTLDELWVKQKKLFKNAKEEMDSVVQDESDNE